MPTGEGHRRDTSPRGRMVTITGRRSWRPSAIAGAYVALTALLAFCVLPFLWLFLSSVDAHASVYLKVPHWTLHNFWEFLSGTTLRDLANSLIIAGGGTVIAVSLGSMAGYVFSRFRFRARRSLLFGVLLLRVVPQTATIAPLYELVLRLHLNNSYLGLVLVEAAFNVPLVLWMMKGFMDAIPPELEEAAWVDGTTRFGALWRVILPLARPGLGASAMFAFTLIWGDFLTPLVLVQSQSLYPLSVGLFQAYIGSYLVDWGLLTATAVVYVVPAVVLYVLMRRYLLVASFAGAVKA
jgi:multiple sugar transport system permease protein